MAEIARLSHTHEAVMDWMLENPERSLRECAAYFGYTQPWVSQLIHSDVFQAKLRQRRDDIDSTIAADIPAKLRAVADIALERLAAELAKSDSPGFIHETADMVLNRLGYGPQRGGGITVNSGPQVQFVISKDDLAQARGAIIEGTVVARAPGTGVITGTSSPASDGQIGTQSPASDGYNPVRAPASAGQSGMRLEPARREAGRSGMSPALEVFDRE